MNRSIVGELLATRLLFINVAEVLINSGRLCSAFALLGGMVWSAIVMAFY